MTTTTITELGSNLRTLLAAVQVGDTIAIVGNGQEIARLVLPAQTKTTPAATAELDSWAQQRLTELETIFPDPVAGATEELEGFRAERF